MSTLNYIIEANIGLTLFMVVYWIVFRNETAFTMGRIFLLLGIFVSLVFPLLHLQFTEAPIHSLHKIILPSVLPELTVTADGDRENNFSDYRHWVWLFLTIVYGIGIALLTLRFIFQLSYLILTIKKSTIKKVNDLKILEIPEDKTHFSFFSYIFINRASLLTLHEKEKIILHESIHVRQFHSLDILILNVIGIFFWFNPILILYRKIFIQLHEFEADARTVENRDVNEYCTLLAKVALQSADYTLASHFNNSLTLKRIQMMKKIKRKIRPWKVVTMAAIIPLAFYILSCQEQVSETSMSSDEIALEAQQKFDELRKANPDKKFLLMETDEKMIPKHHEMKQKLSSLDPRQITHINLITTTATTEHPQKTYAIIEYDAVIVDEGLRKQRDEDVFTEVDEMAVPAGGLEQFYRYVAKNLRYPTEARMKGIEGKVFVEFVVNTDGSVEVTGISGIGAGCDLEAMRVVQTSPSWTPGKNDGVAVRQKIVLPIAFSMGQSKTSSEVDTPEKAMTELVVVGKKPSN